MSKRNDMPIRCADGSTLPPVLVRSVAGAAIVHPEEARRVVEELRERADVHTWVSQCRATFNDPDGEIRHYRRAELYRTLAAMVDRLAHTE